MRKAIVFNFNRKLCADAVIIPESPRILVVDDQEDVLEALKEILKIKYKPDATQSPIKALQMLKKEPYDILLADLVMDEMDGMELIQAAVKIHPQLISIIITGYASKDNAIRAFKEGVYDFLEKPFSIEIVLQTVERAWKVLRTEMKNLRLLQNIQESEKRYRLLTESVADGVAIIQDRKFAFANKALCSIFSYTKEELVMIDPLMLFHIDFQKKFNDMLEKIENNITVKYFQAPCICGDGRKIWTEQRCNIIEWQERPAALITIRDITENKLREISIKQEAASLRDENIKLRETLKDGYRFGSIIGRSALMLKVYDFILESASTNASVIVYGESGTGKELAARTIHDLSERRNKAFIPVNCSAIPENLLESEFFGYKKGAFTGAVSDKKGFLDIAEGGTLFLDEIGEMSLKMQAKLLRVIDGGGYTPVGSSEIRKPDVRFISATNKDLEAYVQKGLIRSDFFYRIHIIPIRIPPLRERREDLAPLIYHFLQVYSNDKKIITIPENIMEALINYDWPGNVRELQNVIQRYITLKTIDLKGYSIESGNMDCSVCKGITQIPRTQDLRSVMENFEKQYLIKMLALHNGNISKTSRNLGIERRTLQRKIKKYGLN